MTTLLAASAPKYDLKKDIVVSAVIFDTEKRRYINLANLTKYYVYFIEVTLKSRRSYIIVRRYSQFDGLQARLDDRFPLQAGNVSTAPRTLPELPGKIYLKRSAVREVADKRIPDINRYLKKLVSLDPKFSQHEIVLDFLSQTPADIDTPVIKGPDGKVQYVTPAEKARLQARQQEVDGAEEMKGATFKPTSSIKSTGEPPIATVQPVKTISGPRMEALHDFYSTSSHELSFKKGDVIPLISKVDANWFEGSHHGKLGLVPAPFVKIIEDVIDAGWEDEWEDDSPTTVIRCYYEGSIKDIDVDPKLADKPTYPKLCEAVRSSLGSKNLILNYQDIQGDLIMLKDQSDIDLLLVEASVNPQQAISGYVPWELHISKEGDYSVYNVNPYRY
ncbi:neutrophil cytosol factor 4-like [Glandiceps talaboti]